MDERIIMIEGRMYVGLPAAVIDEFARLQGGNVSAMKIFSKPATKAALRAEQQDMIKAMVVTEYMMSNHMYPPFANEMEGLGILHEEYGEAQDELSAMAEHYVSYQRALRAGDAKKMKSRLSKMHNRTVKAVIELIQVGAMIQKTFALLERVSDD